MVFVPALDRVIVSVHVTFKEIIPDPTAEYFAELKRLKIEVAEELKDPADFQFLVGTQHLNDEDSLCLHLSCSRSYNQALKSPEVDKWKESIAAELHTLQNQRKCWEVVPYLQGGRKNFLSCHIVFKVKMKNSVVDKYKSGLVVDDSRQVHVIDYADSFAPVVKNITLRILLAIAAVHDKYVHQLYLCFT